MSNPEIQSAAGAAAPTQTELRRCLVCGGGAEPYMTKHAAEVAWEVARCPACGFGFVANRPTLEYLQTYYGSLVSPPASKLPRDKRGDCVRLTDHVAALTPLRGWSLDVGSGDGGFSYHLHRHGFKPVLLDFSEDGRALSDDIPDREFHVGSFEDFDPGGRKFSVVLMSQVLEHALGPPDWVRRAASLLEPGGVLAVAVPNFGGVYRLLGRRDPFICPPQHLNFFTATALSRLFMDAGLAVASVRTSSTIALARGGLVRGAVSGAWNRASHVLDSTRFGIILQVCGRAAV